MSQFNGKVVLSGPTAVPASGAPWGGDTATPIRVGLRQNGSTLIAGLAGEWTLEQSIPRFDRLVEDRPADRPVDAIAFDTTGLAAWDSSLLMFLVRGRSYCEAHDLDFKAETLPDSIGRLLDLTRAVPEQRLEDQRSGSFLARLGANGLSTYDGILSSVAFLGEVAQSFVRLLRGRARFRWPDFWVVVQSNSSGALPIVTLISFLVGLIIAFLAAVVLLRLGAGYYASYLVGYGMLREMGSLMTGIIIAGRTGAAFAAELGTMKITEEVDALRTLGVSPIDHLVMPRVLGIFAMMPLLTVYAVFIGILGGLLVAVTMLDLTAGQFITGLLTPLELSDGLLGVFKGTVFGLIIGIAGCMRGMQTGSDAGAVGRAATSAVVTAITSIIVANTVIDWLAALLQV
jgi:phospholipid/cholesterol/gamma-HCH transport system permease protein